VLKNDLVNCVDYNIYPDPTCVPRQIWGLVKVLKGAGQKGKESIPSAGARVIIVIGGNGTALVFVGYKPQNAC
jgi:hypothetical protein